MPLSKPYPAPGAWTWTELNALETRAGSFNQDSIVAQDIELVGEGEEVLGADAGHTYGSHRDQAVSVV
eukprot:g8801.t1